MSVCIAKTNLPFLLKETSEKVSFFRLDVRIEMRVKEKSTYNRGYLTKMH